MHKRFRLVLAILLAFICLPGARPAVVAAKDPARIIVFGDSLSDSGGIPAPTPPYFEGRWSNGYTFADGLAPRFGIGPTLLPSSVPGGTNFARAGARIGGTNGVIEQIAAYLQVNEWRADRHAVFVVFIGGNDVRDGLLSAFTSPSFDPAAFVDRRVGTLAVALNALSALGARHISVMNLPDLSKLPGLPPPAVGLAAFMSARFNAGLNLMVGQLSRHDDGDASLVDVSQFFGQILTDAAAGGPRYGILNVTEPCLVVSGNTVVSVCSNPDSYLFWDPIHPTGRVHDLLSDFVFDAVGHKRRHD